MKDTRLTFPLEAKAEGAAGIVAGYASTFNGKPDSFGDIIAPGAFTDSLKHHKEANTRPALLWSHDQASPIGKLLDIEQDDFGLHVRTRLTLSVPLARNAFALAADDCLAFSIGFGVVEKSQRGNSRIIEKAHLAEISLVAMPANSIARITDVKSLLEIEDIRSYEAFLRDYGLSNSEAKRLSVGGWKAFKTESSTYDLLEALHASTIKFSKGN